MTDTIKPALTPDEWNRVRSAETYLKVMLDPSPFGPPPEPNHFRAMALANAALPDDDPRKITPHSVWIIRKLIEDAYIDMQHPGAIQFRRDAEQLAAKLAALLPPA